MLWGREAKTYYRPDRGETRCGFIAQDIYESIPAEWQNLVGRVQHVTSPPGLAEPTAEEYLTLDYARLTAVLWQCCKDLDARIQSLEAQSAKPEATRKEKRAVEGLD